MRNVKNVNIEMSAGTTIQEELKMRNVKNVNIEMSAGTTIQEELKMRNVKIEEAKKIITEELTYASHSCIYMEEDYRNYRSNVYWTDEYTDKLHHLYSIKEILDRSIERIYDARIERGVSEEELGREIDERRTELYRKAFQIEREIIELTPTVAEAEEISEEEKEENIEEAKKIITEELTYASHSCIYMEEDYRNYRSNVYWTDEYTDKLHHLYSIKEILDRSIERIYDARIERGVSEEELGREIDERRTELYRKAFQIEREIIELTPTVTEEY